MLLVYLFAYFARVNVCSFSLPVGIRGWLRLVIVALHSLDFSTNVFISKTAREPNCGYAHGGRHIDA